MPTFVATIFVQYNFMHRTFGKSIFLKIDKFGVIFKILFLPL